MKRRRMKTWLLALTILTIGGAVSGWWWQNSKLPDGAEGNPTTAEVVRRDFSSSVLATGAVQPQVGAEVRVGARISGKVESLCVNIGDSVTKDQLIAELEKDDLQATVAQRQAELDLAEAKFDAVESLGPKEIDWMENLKQEVPEALFPLQQDGVGERHNFSALFTIVLSKRFQASVANDSGVGHMFAVGGQPLISLFGRTVPEKFKPMSPALTIIKAQDYGDREMRAIPLAPVIEALETALKN